MASKDHEEIVELMRQQINATDRTTHAVRAIVIPSTIVLIALLVSVPLILIGLIPGLWGFWALASTVLLAGVAGAIAAQIFESRLSAIPGTYITEVTPSALSSPTRESGSEIPPEEMTADPNTRKCSSCGASFPKTRMVCPECGMN